MICVSFHENIVAYRRSIETNTKHLKITLKITQLIFLRMIFVLFEKTKTFTDDKS